MARVRRFVSRESAARFAITLFALVAFTLQSYVTQTHIHGAARTGIASGVLALDTAPKQQQDKFPPGDDPANCPICQQILHAGQYVTPSAAAMLLPNSVASVIALIIDVAVVTQAFSHGWKSRAPPLA